ncbi:MAG: polyprenyl synthetase family protein [Micrococcales bacterium]|nr:polyprenyl synthetase family protein [Micrococcales bacterium]
MTTPSATLPSVLDEFADPTLRARLEEGLAAVEARLGEVAHRDDPVIGPPVAHLLKAGGKRMRPLLTLLAAELADGATPAVIDAAAAVELTHLASLYHDDVMDQAALRRGVAAAHLEFTPTIAILAGDWLFAQASTLVAGLGPEAVRIQAGTFARLCEGQIRETTGPGPTDDPIAHHLLVIEGKTACLITSAAHLGALLAGASPATVDAVVAYAHNVGVAFQLADDIIDLTATPDVTGKAAGTDLRERVPTMPLLLLEAQAKRDQARGLTASDAIVLTRDIAGNLDDDATLASVLSRLTASPALQEAREIARRWSADAIAALAPLPPTPAQQALETFAHHTISRLS